MDPTCSKAAQQLASSAPKDQTAIVEETMELLADNCYADIDRYVYTGIRGNEFASAVSDFSVVIFVNDEEPELYDILLDFKNALIHLVRRREISLTSLHVTPWSIILSVKDFEFELLPTLNLVDDTETFEIEPLIKEQRMRTLEKIQKNKGPNHYIFSTALFESQMSFFSDLPAFSNQLATLAKKWLLKQVRLTDDVFGSMAFIQIVMVHAASIEENCNYVNCIRRFFKLLQEFDNLNINIEVGDININEIPGEIKNQRPLVLEIHNPYHNICQYWNTASKEKLIMKAAEFESILPSDDMDFADLMDALLTLEKASSDK